MSKKQLICMWVGITAFAWMGIAARVSLPESIASNSSAWLLAKFIIYALPVLAISSGLFITFTGNKK